MNPMVTGTGTLIGDGIAGSLVDLDNRKQFDWEIKQGNFIYGGSGIEPAGGTCLKNHPDRCAAEPLYGQFGEILATVFKRQARYAFLLAKPVAVIPPIIAGRS